MTTLKEAQKVVLEAKHGDTIVLHNTLLVYDEHGWRICSRSDVRVGATQLIETLTNTALPWAVM